MWCDLGGDLDLHLLLGLLDDLLGSGLDRCDVRVVEDVPEVDNEKL